MRNAAATRREKRLGGRAAPLVGGAISPAGLLVVGDILIPIVALLCGMLGGYQFPLASSLFFAGRESGPQNTGALYAVDLLGACIGAIVLSEYFVPVFGFLKTASLIFVVNLATALLAFMAAFREKLLPA